MKRFFAMILVALVSVVSYYSLNAQEFVSTSPQGRTAVLEEFTGIYCVFCPDGHRIAQELYDTYPGKFIAINIHTGGYANPQKASDPDFRTQWGEAIASISGLTGYPAGQVNRELFNGASALAMGRGSWAGVTQQVLNSGNSPVNVAVRNTFDQAANKVTIEVEMYYTGNAGENNKLNVAILENGVVGYQTGGEDPNNYVHNHILRDLVTGQWGETITETTSGSYVKKTYEYTFPDGIIAANCDVVAFVTQNDNRYIYTGHEQSVAVRYKVFSELSKMYYTTGNGTATTVNITLKNPNDAEIQVETTFDEQQLISGWSVDIVDDVVTIPAGGTANVSANVTGSSAVAYLPLTFESTPINLPEGAAGVPAKSSIGVLHEDARNIFFYGTTDSPEPYLTAFAANTVYNSTAVFLPLDPAVMDAYPADDFNFVWFATDYWNRGVISHEAFAATASAVYGYANDILAKGGKVMINGPLELTNATAPAAASFYSNVLGISKGSAVLQMVEIANNQISGMRAVKLNGIAGDEIAGGMTFTLNQYTQANPFFQIFADGITMNPGSSSTLFMNMEWQGTNYGAAVRNKVGDGKIVFTTFGFNAFGSAADASKFYNAVVEWFEGGGSTGGNAVLSTNVGDGSIIFEDTYVNENSFYDLTITNNGDATLDLNGVQLLNNSSNTFAIASGSGGFTLEPGASKNIKIMFSPKEEGNYTASLKLNSNATNSEVIINIEAASIINSVKDGVAGNESVFTMQVGPNPLLDAGTLTYSINGSASRNVKIDLVNSKGELVATIINGVVSSGTHTINLNSAEFSSGNYFLIGTADGYNTQLPLVIVK